MNHELIVEHIKNRAGLAGAEDAEQTLRAVLIALGALIPDRDRELLFGSLPEEARAVLGGAEYRPGFDSRELYPWAAALENVGLGSAVEHVQVVCETLAMAMPGDALRLLHQHLPEGVAALFCDPPPPPASSAEHLTPLAAGTGSTLASGRPTSRHPIAEAVPERTLATGRPGSEHPIAEAADAPAPRTAQGESVVRSPNPHRSRKLSSSTGR